MRNKRMWWMTALGCIAAGVVILGIGMAMGGHSGYYIDRSGVHAAGNVTKNQPYIQEKIKIDKFSSMSISLDYADFEVIPSDGYYLEYRIDGNDRAPEWTVKNEKLTFNEREPRAWGGFMIFGGFTVNDSYEVSDVKVYVPENAELVNVRIDSDDGDVTLPSMNVKSLTTECEYGDLSIESIKGNKWEAVLDDGDLKTGPVELEKVSVENDYGNCTFEELKCKTGSIVMGDGQLKIDSSDVADLRVDNEYGFVTIKTKDSWEKYDMDLYTEYGRIELPNGQSCYRRDDDEESYSVRNGNDKKISVNCDDGDIRIVSGKN